MAITITKKPEGIYPAYNNSFIEFASDLADNFKAEITVYPTVTFTKKFVIYADLNGKYIFNLKEAVKVNFNENGFQDNNVFTSAYWASVAGLYLSQNIDIEVFNDSTSESTSETYEFYKGVKQIGESVFSNPFQLLSFTLDGVNHYMTYFEGFPFAFDIQKVVYASGKVLTVKSLNSGNVTDNMPVTTTGAFRINIDKGGGDNWTSDNILPLIDGLNRLEVYENGVFKSNLLLTKKYKCSGVFLKWFNSSGGYSHFLFNEFKNENVKSEDVDFVIKDEFENIGSATGFKDSIGKDAEKYISVKVKYNQSEYNVLKDIFLSPSIQMYSSNSANVSGTFIDVGVDGGFQHNNKKEFNILQVKIDLPKLVTAKL